jgi:basic amino acid/polyamine antiporter, APA family
MEKNKSKKSLKRELGLIEVFSIASGAMISSGLFVLPGIAYSKTGSSVVLAYFIGSLIMIPALLSMSELATAMPKAGGDYFFIDRSMGPSAGMIGGLSSWFALTSKTAFALIGIGAFVQLFNPGLSDFNLKLIAISFCLIFTFINLFGVKHAGRTQVYLVIGLIFILLAYIVLGFPHIEIDRFEPVIKHGTASVFATAGFIFVSFMGLTHVCSAAEEIKNPKRNIPLGMISAWAIISALYLLVVFVTVGLLEHKTLETSLMPVSLGASVFLGDFGLIILGVAAILAFITTANAGLLSSSRYPLALSKDELLPRFLSKISKRGVPIVSLLFTSAVMILIILFLDLDGLVKAASTLVLLLYVFVNFSLIVMRESNIRNYRPSFHSPLYPWVQIAGIIAYFVLIYQMGIFPMILVGCFICGGFGWYWFFARDKIKREYSLIHVVERITGEKNSNYYVDEELREILIDRDNIDERHFKDLIKNCKILDLDKLLHPDDFAKVISQQLCEKLEIKKQKLCDILLTKKSDSNIVVHPGIAIFSHLINGKDKFEIVLGRTKKGLFFLKDTDPIYRFFVIVASEDQKNFYWHSLMWLTQIADQDDFQEKWVKAKTTEELRDIFIKAWEERKI